MGAISIDDLGVVAYLDASAAAHNKHTGKEFEGYLKKIGVPQDGFVRITKSGLANLYGVSRTTLDDWIRRYNKEHEVNDGSAV